MSTGADQVPSYGIVPISRKTSFDPKRHGRERRKYSLVEDHELPREDLELPIIAKAFEKKPGPWDGLLGELLYTLTFVIFGGVLTLITYYHWTSGNTGFEKFMDSQGFGVRFMMTVLGVVVKLFWSNIDKSLFIFS
jgi:hypothetical protein